MFDLNYVRLLVDDFATSFHFYQHFLGLPVRFGGPDDIYAEFESGSATLALFRRDLMAEALEAPPSQPSPGFHEAVVIIMAVEDVDTVVQALQDRGVAFQTKPQDRPDWGIRTAHLRDPEGNLIELNAPLQQGA